jgi:hypothetical protein
MVKYFEKSGIVILTVVLVCALAFLIGHLAADAPPTAPGVENSLPADRMVTEIEGYKNWTKVNPVPQVMPGRVATDCFLWTAPGGVIVNGESNPHRDKYLTVYVNETGRGMMLTRKSPVFPEGTVIVKEKLTTKDSRTPELLTVMIKQKQGFNPASGDWEYMVVDGTGTKMQGRGDLKNCQGCHLAHKKTDYIFRTYLPGDVASKLK